MHYRAKKNIVRLCTIYRITQTELENFVGSFIGSLISALYRLFLAWTFETKLEPLIRMTSDAAAWHEYPMKQCSRVHVITAPRTVLQQAENNTLPTRW